MDKSLVPAPPSSDTIAALATPAGFGALGVIRLSGPRSLVCAQSCFSGKTPLADCPTHTVHYGLLLDTQGQTVDDVCLTVFRAPHSYTGEDSVEISFHGNPLIARRILALLTAQPGVRAAEPGEFTKRAFLNGKMDLSQAEAVADVIAARTDAALSAAQRQRSGAVSHELGALREKLVEIAGLLELELDFSEEQAQFIARRDLIRKIDETSAAVDRLAQTYALSRTLRDGLNVALVGPPNTGKSSLLNALLRQARAIVSPVAGTTRDVLREEIELDGLLVRLHDTAGLRKTRARIETQGLAKTREAVEGADVVVFLCDARRGIPKKIYASLRQWTTPDRILPVLNKIDLKRPVRVRGHVLVSAKTGEGLDVLCRRITGTALGPAGRWGEESGVLVNARHFEKLQLSRRCLAAARQGISSGGTQTELVAVDIRAAARHLEEIVGALSADDTLNAIFSSFCIGK